MSFMKELLSSQWTKIIFTNYLIPVEIVEKRLPREIKLDYLNGKCCVSLVGFQFGHIKFANVKLPTLKDFEQIDLRVHVKRFDGARWRKGSIILSRILDNSALKILSKIFINSDSITSTTHSKVVESENSLDVAYAWNFRDVVHELWVKANDLPSPYEPRSETAFFLDRPFEWTLIGEDEVRETEFIHSHWQTYQVNEYGVKIDFAMEFGAEFSLLSSMVPYSVILAEGSTVTIRDNGNV